jgi:4-amino-4-deoxy-L-arabinose transferase-like glycosyltransferase
MMRAAQDIKASFFYIPVAGIFLLIISPSLLSDGMFMDGVMYATMSKNLAHGLGTFWQSHMSEFIFPDFVNHPPLAIGLESIFFRILGDSRFTERFYSLLTIILTGLFIVLIWKSVGKKSSAGWLPLFFWIIIPSVSWTAVNNMLENTMGVFIILAVLFYIKSQKNRRLLYLILGGLMLSCGFLTKGFVTFFPLTFPFFFWLFNRKSTFLNMISDTLIILFSSVIALLLLYLLVPGYHETLPKYLAVTFDLVVNSTTKNTRFYIIYRLLMELLPAAGTMTVFIFICLKKSLSGRLLKSNLNLAASFFCLGLSGVLPIMITKVQSGYYLLTSLPFFAISIGLLVSPLVESLIEKINYNSPGFKLFAYSGISIFVLGIVLSLFFSGHINRDKNMIKDMRVINTVLPENCSINILPGMYTNWKLHAYYARYWNISLDHDLNNKHEYLLIDNSMYSDTIEYGFKRVDLRTNEFELFRRKH